MSLGSFFEIDEATYHSPKLKPGRWHRLVISWSPPDSKNQTERVTERVKPTGDPNKLRCIWSDPSVGKRFVYSALKRSLRDSESHELGDLCKLPPESFLRFSITWLCWCGPTSALSCGIVPWILTSRKSCFPELGVVIS
ncbi:hypothetical protein DL93DRAFT_761048 [Clavulina sp. PMI_390]|nr:hypothetical protein DL93DRAFT_761048 [Clavulina sp. PMI_390]